ncbi:MAG: hypothetical protein ACR2JH_02265 [Solirubrobacteraceae bacterium]
MPQQWRTGPILAEVAYPGVLVARAVTDREKLELVLRAGNGGGRTTLAIERLVPEREYMVEGGLDDRVVAEQSTRSHQRRRKRSHRGPDKAKGLTRPHCP